MDVLRPAQCMIPAIEWQQRVEIGRSNGSSVLKLVAVCEASVVSRTLRLPRNDFSMASVVPKNCQVGSVPVVTSHDNIRITSTEYEFLYRRLPQYCAWMFYG